MIVSALCAIFCVKKIFQESFLVIEDDGFSIKKGDKEGKFYFKDIENIDTRTIDTKKNVQILSVKFKRNKFDKDTTLIQSIADDEAIILDNYEKSIHELRPILRQNLRSFKETKSE